MSRIVVGFTGDKDVGIGSVVSRLEQKGFKKFSLVRPLKDIAADVELSQDNEILKKFSSRMRANFGEDILARGAEKWVREQGGPLVVLYGIRNPDEINYLKDRLGASILGIRMPDEMQFELARERYPELPFRTAVEFMLAKWERLGGEATAYRDQIAKCLSLADRVIDNNGSLDDLYDNVVHALRDNNLYQEGSYNIYERR